MNANSSSLMNTLGLNGSDILSSPASALRHGNDLTNNMPFVHKLLRYSDYLYACAQRFFEHTVVDLGAGSLGDGYVLAHLSGATAYVGVEHAHANDLFHNTRISHMRSDELDRILVRQHGFMKTVSKYDSDVVSRVCEGIEQYFSGEFSTEKYFVSEDMLSTSKRFPDYSVGVLVSGIDRTVMTDDVYARSVEEEISRILHPNSSLIEMDSRFHPRKLVRSDNSDTSFEEYRQKE